MAGKKRTKPIVKVTAKFIKDARKYAALGLTRPQIANNLGISTRTLQNKISEIPELVSAMDAGKDEGIRIVANELFKKCKQGDVGAIKYYLNNRDKDNWRDRVIQTHEGSLALTDLSESEIDRKILELSKKLEQSRKG